MSNPSKQANNINLSTKIIALDSYSDKNKNDLLIHYESSIDNGIKLTLKQAYDLLIFL